MSTATAIVPISDGEIQSRIQTIRGVQVMLDRDLAALYGVDVKRLNEQVNRNIERFPERFMHQLTEEEFQNLKSQIATSSSSSNLAHLKSQIATPSWGGVRKPPKVFTEQGISMLSAVLHSPTAIETSIRIMDAFVAQFNKQYGGLSEKRTDKFHDRYLIIDHATLIHVGASLNHLGKRCFAFSTLAPEFIPDILARVPS